MWHLPGACLGILKYVCFNNIVSILLVPCRVRQVAISVRLVLISVRIPDPGSRIPDPRSWTLDTGFRIPDPGSWLLDTGFRIQDPGSRIPVSQDPKITIIHPRCPISHYYGSKIPDPVSWIKDPGFLLDTDPGSMILDPRSYG